MNIIKKLLFKNEDGIILFSIMLLSMVFLALGLTMLYQANTTFQMSAVTRDKIETFMTAETGYEASASRMIFLMETAICRDSLQTAWPGDASGWPNYLVRVYDDPTNPQNFRLVPLPSTNYWDDDVLNRDLSGQPDVSDDAANPAYFLITRADSVTSATVFQMEDASYAGSASAYHFYRAWLEPDRLLDSSAADRTCFLMVEGFKGNPNSTIDASSPNYIPQTRVLMQYRIRLSRNVQGWENEDDSGSAAMGRGGTSASTSGGEIDITAGGSTRTNRTGT
jgi:hypothetical protein